ncbi:alpha-D-ribose 1-methylphosphonate 5-triphosphate diphosphatase [Allohahella marinimesophila]|uniref:Alpha-D-ribose 1-methylphosphonate 5-triphosphate diphosphatase n=1 Tax=Allohahella marinimesophila TaxID=1054972 RepID=A0ABP7P170_9GAMM
MSDTSMTTSHEHSSSECAGTLRHCLVLAPDGWRLCRQLDYADGRITKLDLEPGPMQLSDSPEGLEYLMPGIVDIHGDAFERHITPRAGTQFPLELALGANDHGLIGAGITSFFYSITDGFEPGPRSRDTVRTLIEAVESLRPRMRCHGYIHIRHELVNTALHEELMGWLIEGRIDLLSLNDHLPPADNEAKIQRYLQGLARRVSMSDSESRDFIAALQAERETGLAQVSELSACAVEHGIRLASHDDRDDRDLEQALARGVSIAEFPMSLTLASRLRSEGIKVLLGAPNLVRGGSHVGGLDVEEALRHGQIDALCSDYHYASLFHAPFLIARMGLLPLDKAWKLVSEYPAAAVGLGNRTARIEVGYDADFLMMSALDGNPLSLRQVVAGGKLALDRE